MKKLCLISCIALFVCVSVFAEDIMLPRLAVVEFSINDTNNQKLVNDAIAVRNQVQSNIIKSGKYDVIARQEIDKLLENQKIQVSAISASENIKKLKLLNISYMVTGSVDALDNDYVVSISVLDVANGKFTYSDEEFIGNSASEIYKGIGTLTSRFLQGINSEGAQIVAKSQTLRTNDSGDTMIRITTGYAAEITYLYDQYYDKYDAFSYQKQFKEDKHYLWENESFDMPISQPGTYLFRIKSAVASKSLYRYVYVSRKGFYQVLAFMPPQNVNVNNITNTSCDITWDSYNHDYVSMFCGYNEEVECWNRIDEKSTIYYKIQYYKKDEPASIKEKNTKNNNIQLYGLSKDTEYVISVITQEGWVHPDGDFWCRAESPAYTFEIRTGSE